MYLALTVPITVYSYMNHSPVLNVEVIWHVKRYEDPTRPHGVTFQTPVIFSVTFAQKLLEKQALKGVKLQ